MNSKPRSNAFLVCVECSSKLLRGEITSGRDGVHVDPNVEFEARAALARDLRGYSPRILLNAARTMVRWLGPAYASERQWVRAALPTRVPCPRCAAGRDDPCRGAWYCHERIEENLQRLESLPTYATTWSSPCCGHSLYLIWRKITPSLSWMGIPCLADGCDKTYSIELDEGDLVGDRILSERIHPQMVEMTAWGVE
ncbi:MAG: hypothetical protein MJD61_21655 [Proteobacteria bacterium]|nr:hypothetical protein [Pseudomonadota bacterium]